MVEILALGLEIFRRTGPELRIPYEFLQHNCLIELTETWEVPDGPR